MGHSVMGLSPWPIACSDGQHHSPLFSYSHISAMGGPIWTKFGSSMQNNTPITVKWLRSKPEIKFHNGGRLFFQSGSSCGSAVNWAMSKKFGLQSADIFWTSEDRDINKQETGNSIRSPRQPSWKIDMTSYFRSGWPDLDITTSRLRWNVKNETVGNIQIWRTFIVQNRK